MIYQKRIVDEILDYRMDIFGAILIVGPKGCGKTFTAKVHSKSFVEFQDEEIRENYLQIAESFPSRLLVGEKPRLFDEWQDAPKIWGTIRKYCDDNPMEKGSFILTGSSSNGILTPHTGTLRISTIEMYPMSLYEMGESNGEVDLIDLFNNPDSFQGCESKLTIDDLIFAICRGGWPLTLTVKDKEKQLYIVKDLLNQTCKKDVSAIDKIKRNPVYVESILKSYSRNICTLAANTSIYEDCRMNCGISETSFKEYIDALERLYIISDVEAWCPSIRSKSNLRSGKKHNLIDPSLAVAALGINPSYFDNDFKTLGFLFESLCIRDLKIYSQKYNGKISYYHDRYGLEADAVLHLEDGRYALIEFKLGSNEIDLGAKHLNEIETLIKENNNKEKQCPLSLPNLKIIITATQYGYRRTDGVFVIPIGCLK